MKTEMKMLEISFIPGMKLWLTTESTSESTALPRSAVWRFRNQV